MNAGIEAENAAIQTPTRIYMDNMMAGNALQA